MKTPIKPKPDKAPNDATSYFLVYTTPTFTARETLDTPTAVRDRLAELREEGVRLLDVSVIRGTEDDISGEF